MNLANMNLNVLAMCLQNSNSQVARRGQRLVTVTLSRSSMDQAKQQPSEQVTKYHSQQLTIPRLGHGWRRTRASSGFPFLGSTQHSFRRNKFPSSAKRCMAICHPPGTPLG